MPRKARSNENSNPNFLNDRRRGNGGPTMLRPGTGLLGTVNKKKKVLLNAHDGERAFAREIQNFVGGARGCNATSSRATVAGGGPSVRLESDLALRVALGLGVPDPVSSGLQRLAEEFEALDLQDERVARPPSVPTVTGLGAGAEISIATATTVSSGVAAFPLMRAPWNSSSGRRPSWARDTADCPFCGVLGVAPAIVSSDQASSASVDMSISRSAPRCRCHRYSRVFNRRNSFRSIASQSTPVARTIRLVQCALDPGLGAQSQISDVSGANLSAQDRDSASGQATKAGAGDTSTSWTTTNCRSGTTMTQLATQLNACTLSPCADSNFYATQCAGITGRNGSSSSDALALSTQSSTRSLSLSLGYIHAAFPLQDQDQDFRLDF